jgi:histone acetyltransferase (RNA polymerase elongator complex component)
MDNDAAADADETMNNNSYSNSRVTTATTTDVSIVDNDATADAVIMYSLKVSLNDLQSMIHTLPTDTAIMGGTLPSTWVVKARELFFGRLSSLMNKKHDDDDDDDDDIAAADEESLEDCIALSENETAIMNLIVELAT